MFAIAALVAFLLNLILHLAGFHSTERLLDESSLLYLGLGLLSAHFVSRRG